IFRCTPTRLPEAPASVRSPSAMASNESRSVTTSDTSCAANAATVSGRYTGVSSSTPPLTPARRTVYASEGAATPNHSTPRRSSSGAVPARPWPYAFALTAASTLVVGGTSALTLARLCSKASRSMTAVGPSCGSVSLTATKSSITRSPRPVGASLRRLREARGHQREDDVHHRDRVERWEHLERGGLELPGPLGDV